MILFWTGNNWYFLLSPLIKLIYGVVSRCCYCYSSCYFWCVLVCFCIVIYALIVFAYLPIFCCKMILCGNNFSISWNLMLALYIFLDCLWIFSYLHILHYLVGSYRLSVFVPFSAVIGCVVGISEILVIFMLCSFYVSDLSVFVCYNF